MTGIVLEHGDARALPVGHGEATAVVTSPPYLQQRVYGDHPNEIGRCRTVAEYVTQIREVGYEMKRIINARGTWWLNLGDKANDSGGAGGDHAKGSSKAHITKYGTFYDPAYPKGSLLDVPGKVLAALQADGWILRSRVTWDKGQVKPEDINHVRRPLYASEVIFMLTRERNGYRFNPDVLAELGDVWHFPPGQPLANKHFAPFPDELARRCILASTRPGDLVIDPFAGSGTTCRVAVELGRRARGFDLYTEAA